MKFGLFVFFVLGVFGQDEYDDKDVQFEQSAPNLLILLADPKNGTTLPLSNKPNSDVVLDRSFERVHLFCSAYYPIKWEYSGDGFPLLNVDQTRFTEDFYDPTTYAFSALLELQGLKESQSGNYTCRKFDDSSFSSSFHIFVPGQHLFLAQNSSDITVQDADKELRIPCSVSDPTKNVTIKKGFYKGDGGWEWMPISPTLYKFDVKSGFTFTGDSALAFALGQLRCSSGEKHVYFNVIKGTKASDESKDDCCNKTFLQSLGEERTSCRAFISERCQNEQYLDPLKNPCKDWKLPEFFANPIELCKEEIAPSNSSVAVGYFSPPVDGDGPRLFMYCQANPREYTQGFKMAVEWKNGSMIFIDDERLLMPSLSEFPSGYEVHAEVTDLLNPEHPFDPVTLHCYIPLKYSFKWIKMLKPVALEDLKSVAEAWYEKSNPTQQPSIPTQPETPPQRPQTNPQSTLTPVTAPPTPKLKTNQILPRLTLEESTGGGASVLSRPLKAISIPIGLIIIYYSNTHFT